MTASRYRKKPLSVDELFDAYHGNRQTQEERYNIFPEGFVPVHDTGTLILLGNAENDRSASYPNKAIRDNLRVEFHSAYEVRAKVSLGR